MKTKKFCSLISSLLLMGSQAYSQSSYSVEYNHKYTWQDEGIDMEITVKGEVPFHTGTNFAVIPKCQTGSTDRLDSVKVVSVIEGEGEITARGKSIYGDKSDPENLVVMEYTLPVKIKITGKTWFKDGTCAEMWNLALEEDWTGKVQWKYEAKSPEAAAMAEALSPATFAQMNNLDQHTLEFQRYPVFADKPLVLLEDAFPDMGFPMHGKLVFRVNVPGIHKVGIDEQYDEDNSIQPNKEYRFSDLHWGPPLDQIKWNVVDVDKL
jgi:hypothetical protein